MGRRDYTVLLDPDIYSTWSLGEPHLSCLSLVGDLEGGCTPTSLINYPEYGQSHLASQGHRMGIIPQRIWEVKPCFLQQYLPSWILASREGTWYLLTSRDLAESGSVPYK